MIGKIYTITWIPVLAAAGITYLTGNFNELSMTIFGFIFAALVFAAPVAVLPWWIDKTFTYRPARTQ